MNFLLSGSVTLRMREENRFGFFSGQGLLLVSAFPSASSWKLAHFSPSAVGSPPDTLLVNHSPKKLSPAALYLCAPLPSASDRKLGADCCRNQIKHVGLQCSRPARLHVTVVQC